MTLDKTQSQRPMTAILLLSSIILFFEFFGGIFSNSLALLSDSGHMLTDVLALVLALFAFWIARERPENEKQTFGYYRFEILSALINGIVLVVIVGAIFAGALQRIYSPPQINLAIMLPIAIIGLAANLFSIFILLPHSHENLNIKGAFWHIIADAISSVCVVLGGIIIWFTGFNLIDPILSVLIGVLIIRGAYSLLLEAVNILLESAPDNVELADVVKSVKTIKGIKDMHHVHIWTITSGYLALSAHVEIEDKMVSQCADLLTEINKLLHEKHNIRHATLQLECENNLKDISCL